VAGPPGQGQRPHGEDAQEEAEATLALRCGSKDGVTGDQWWATIVRAGRAPLHDRCRAAGAMVSRRHVVGNTPGEMVGIGQVRKGIRAWTGGVTTKKVEPFIGLISSVDFLENRRKIINFHRPDPLMEVVLTSVGPTTGRHKLK
jgi:hypothetical protein